MGAGIVEVASSRVYSKGTKVYYARQATPTTFARMAGLISVSGPSYKREVVDATELDPDPEPADLPTGFIEEMYYQKRKYPGTKDVDPITINLNMKMTQYLILCDMFAKDELPIFELRFRNGYIFHWQAFIESVPLELEENQLGKVALTVGCVNIVTILPP